MPRVERSTKLIASELGSAMLGRLGGPVVAWLAQGLPVGRVPEELHVATVRDDVVDHSGVYLAHGALEAVIKAGGAGGGCGRRSFGQLHERAAAGLGKVDERAVALPADLRTPQLNEP